MDNLPLFGSYTFVIGGLAFVLLLAMGELKPLRARRHRLWPRLMVNLIFSALAFGVGALVVRPVAMEVLGWSSQISFGLIYLLPGWPLLRFVASFALMDLTFYYWHRLNHHLPILWRFHLVHHMDPDMDVSTGFRFHLVEVLLSALFRMVQVGLIGVSLPTYTIYELCFQAATMFHHSNVKLPLGLARLLNLAVVTPRMHGIHHSVVEHENNSNFSVIFRWWDWLHKTLELKVRQAELRVGIPAYLKPEDRGLIRLLVIPFQKQRDYWRYEEGILAAREPELGQQRLWE